MPEISSPVYTVNNLKALALSKLLTNTRNLRLPLTEIILIALKALNCINMRQLLALPWHNACSSIVCIDFIY